MMRALLLMLAAGMVAFAAFGQRAPAYADAGETRTALQQALAERDAAQQRSTRLEAEAEATENAAQRTARQTAALAARIQQAEAGIAAAEARLGLIGQEQVRLRAVLGRQQRPIVTLTAALQQFARRPVALSLLRPGEIRDLVYLRAVMASTVPQVQARTTSLRRRIDRSAQLQREAGQAAQVLRAEQDALDQRRTQLASVEARQRLAAREAGSVASREAERALALGEQARDLDSLVGELDRAAEVRTRLAALPGPVLRPEAGAAASAEPAPPAPTSSAIHSTRSRASIRRRWAAWLLDRPFCRGPSRRRAWRGTRARPTPRSTTRSAPRRSSA